jgi:ABC-2 type transport system permease protein
MFWTLLFPILLATLFNLALSNIDSAENFSKVNVAVVQNAELDNNPAFVSAINGDDDLFNVNYTTLEEAKKLLNDNQVDGYIAFNPDLSLTVSKTGLNQTILNSFLNDYLQSSATVETILTQNPGAFQSGLIESISNRTDYLKDIPAGNGTPNQVVNYFYSLIAMACLYGGFLGVKEVAAIQANISDVGARANMAPAHKMNVFMASILAATTIQLFEILILMIYLTAVLKIDFGNQLGSIALTCIVGTLTGVTFGTTIASVIKKNEGVKIGILIGSTMTMSFLSGMMVGNIKYLITSNCPILAYLNPASLITDSFYALYYYNTNTQFLTDILLLSCFFIAFSLITYFVLRRQKYASL